MWNPPIVTHDILIPSIFNVHTNEIIESRCIRVFNTIVYIMLIIHFTFFSMTNRNSILGINCKSLDNNDVNITGNFIGDLVLNVDDNHVFNREEKQYFTHD